MAIAECRLILVRHAHRDTSNKELDNGLSPQGKTQSQLLAKNLTRLYEFKNTFFYSSPKLRCIETLTPLVEAKHQEIQIDSLLDEQSKYETAHDLKLRVEKFVNHWKKTESSTELKTTIACSHGDWLPLAVELLTGAQAEFDKSGWIEINRSENRIFFRFKN